MRDVTCAVSSHRRRACAVLRRPDLQLHVGTSGQDDDARRKETTRVDVAQVTAQLALQTVERDVTFRRYVLLMYC